MIIKSLFCQILFFVLEKSLAMPSAHIVWSQDQRTSNLTGGIGAESGSIIWRIDLIYALMCFDVVLNNRSAVGTNCTRFLSASLPGPVYASQKWSVIFSGFWSLPLNSHTAAVIWHLTSCQLFSFVVLTLTLKIHLPRCDVIIRWCCLHFIINICCVKAGQN